MSEVKDFDEGAVPVDHDADTPKFNRWKRCPECESLDTRIGTEVTLQGGRHDTTMSIMIWIYCLACGHHSERRTANNVPLASRVSAS